MASATFARGISILFGFFFLSEGKVAWGSAVSLTGLFPYEDELFSFTSVFIGLCGLLTVWGLFRNLNLFSSKLNELARHAGFMRMKARALSTGGIAALSPERLGVPPKLPSPLKVRGLRSEGGSSRQALRIEMKERKRVEAVLLRKTALLELLQRVASAANAATNSAEVTGLCIRSVCEFTGWPVGHAYFPVAPFQNEYCTSGHWHLGSHVTYEKFKRSPESEFLFIPGEVMNEAVRAGRPIWATEPEMMVNPERARAAFQSGLRTGIWVPVALGPELVCLLEFFSDERVPPDNGLSETLNHIAGQLGRVIERERAARALKESEDRFRRLSDLASEGIIIHRDGLVVEANRAIEAITGYRPEEVIGAHVTTYLLTPSSELIRKKLREGDDALSELVLRRKDGKEVVIEVQGKNIFYGGALARVALIRDVTEQRHSNELLRESEERFRRLSEAACEAIILHKDRRIVEVNSAFLKMFGYDDPAEVIGMNALDLVAPAFRELSSDKIRRHDPTLYEMEMLRKDGGVIFVEVRARPIPYGGAVARVATLNDITERKRTEEILREREARLTLLVDQMPAVLWSTDRDLRFTSSVGAGLRLLNLNSAESAGETLFQFFNTTDPTFPAIENHKRALLGESNSFDMEWRGHTFEAHIEPLRNKDGTITGVIGVALDITERKLSEEKLKVAAVELIRSNRELEQFAYVASHDLQEPLRMISSYIDLLARRYRHVMGPDADEYIGYAVDGAKRMKQQIDDLLAYSRVNRKGSDFTRIECAEVLERVLANLRLAVGECKAEVEVGPLPWVLGDPVQLAQLFQNLISNALKFRSERPPRLSISAECVQNEWRFHVEDNGIGIEMEYAERIFLIFQRLHTVSEYPGTGIGLALCKKIVERHGGHIWVESSKGKGSTFKFTLPRPPQEIVKKVQDLR